MGSKESQYPALPRGGCSQQQPLPVEHAHDEAGALHLAVGGAEILGAEAASVGVIGADAGGEEGNVAAPIPVHDLHCGVTRRERIFSVSKLFTSNSLMVVREKAMYTQELDHSFVRAPPGSPGQ